MLKIINYLEPFFEDNYRRVGVREYARIRKISPPSASKLLSELKKEDLLKMEEDRRHHLYNANIKNELFIILSGIYWSDKLKKSGMVEYINETFLEPVIILFGSFSKAEVNKNSDIDIAIIRKGARKHYDLYSYEKKLKRKIHSFDFRDLGEIPKNLVGGILSGYVISGTW